MVELKKMKFLLLLPVWGHIIIMTYLNFKSNKISHIKQKHLFLVGLIIGIIFWVVIFSVFALVSAIMKLFFIANDSLFIGVLVFAFIVANYISYVPCLIYVNYLIKQGERGEEIDIDNEKSNDGDNIERNID